MVTEQSAAELFKLLWITAVAEIVTLSAFQKESLVDAPPLDGLQLPFAVSAAAFSTNPGQADLAAFTAQVTKPF